MSLNNLEIMDALSKLRSLFQKERDRLMNAERNEQELSPPEQAERLTLEEYKEALQNYETAIQNFELTYIPNYQADKAVLLAIPFLSSGIDFRSQQEIQNNIIKILLITEEGQVTNWDDRPGYYLDYLPKEIARDVEKGGCIVTFPQPQSEIMRQSESYKNNVRVQLQKALENLKRLLGLTDEEIN